MQLREFEYILAINKYKSLTKAAEALFVTQPTLSLFLQSYENELGVKLFEKRGKQYYLTYAGQEYVACAAKIIALRDSLKKELDEIANEQKGVFRIGFLPGHARAIAPVTLPPFQKQYPGIDVRLMEDYCEALEQALLNGDIDLVVFNYPKRNPNLRYEFVCKEEVLLVTPKNHPLSAMAADTGDGGHPYMDLKYFGNEPFILQNEIQPIGQTARRLLSKAGISPPIRLITENIQGGIGLAEAGLGCAFSLVYGAAPWPDTRFNVDCYSLGEEGRTLEMTIATRKSDYLPEYADVYMHLVKEMFQSE